MTALQEPEVVQAFYGLHAGNALHALLSELS